MAKLPLIYHEHKFCHVFLQNLHSYLKFAGSNNVLPLVILSEYFLFPKFIHLKEFCTEQITKDYEQNSTEQKSKGSTFHRSFIPCTIP